MDTIIFFFEIDYFEQIRSSKNHQNNICERKKQTEIQNCIFNNKSDKNE